jgi:hypothetical protein
MEETGSQRGPNVRTIKAFKKRQNENESKIERRKLLVFVVCLMMRDSKKILRAISSSMTV